MQTENRPPLPGIRYDERQWRPRPTLGSADYVGQAVYDEEREKIWWGDWVAIGRSEEVADPGDFVVKDLSGESIFLVRDAEGTLNGFYNVCSHRGTKFLDDDTKGNVRKAFRCPYHAWTYDLNGRLIGTPNVAEDEYFDRERYPLHSFAVGEYAGFVFANLAAEPRPLMDALTDGAESITAFERFKMDELRVGIRIVYEVEANWKIIVENYNECLHCPQVHPELVQVVPLFRFGEVWDEETRDDGNWMKEGATSFTANGESELPKFPDLLPEDYRMYYGSYEFPNLMLNLHPDCVMYYIGIPKGPTHTQVISEYLFRPEVIADPNAFKPEPVVEFWDLISKQDWDVCQRAQTGVGSRAFTAGVYPRQDRFLYNFNEEWREKMGRPLNG
ncbi:MAG TPA: aromatic ring-hydroxylating dioxygenase subunit alpha [Actinomycetota bacterium]|nr:aromatic ring-hydroxylating dioxygenase subunit alpha [Actinomycetota bacterium]